jgi:hypothetical protein
MRANGIQGAKRRGKPWRTTTPDGGSPRPADLVQREFVASGPDELWCADFTYLRCREGVVFFSFVIDVYSRAVVGWQFADHMRTDLVLDALRMALARRGPGADVELIHHSDAGSQGGFNWSSQHSSERSCDEDEEASGGSGWSAGDAVAGASAGGAAGASCAVLGGGRSRPVDGGGCRGGGGLGAGCFPLVPGGWWDAIDQHGPALGAIPLVRGARRDRASEGSRLWRAGDRASARPLPFDDLA